MAEEIRFKPSTKKDHTGGDKKSVTKSWKPPWSQRPATFYPTIGQGYHRQKFPYSAKMMIFLSLFVTSHFNSNPLRWLRVTSYTWSPCNFILLCVVLCCYFKSWHGNPAICDKAKNLHDDPHFCECYGNREARCEQGRYSKLRLVDIDLFFVSVQTLRLA